MSLIHNINRLYIFYTFRIMQIGQAVNITVEEGVRHITPGLLSGMVLVLVIVLITLWTGLFIGIIATQANLWLCGIAILGVMGLKILFSKVPWKTRFKRLQTSLARIQTPQTQLTKTLSIS